MRAWRAVSAIRRVMYVVRVQIHFAACSALYIYMTAHDTKRGHFVNAQKQKVLCASVFVLGTLPKTNAL